MKNIVTVARLNDKARRIYELPENVTLQPGTLVRVETRSGDLLYGQTVTPSALMDDAAVTTIKATLGMDETGNFLKVKAAFGEPEEMIYATDEQEPNETE